MLSPGGQVEGAALAPASTPGPSHAPLPASGLFLSPAGTERPESFFQYAAFITPLPCATLQLVSSLRPNFL